MFQESLKILEICLATSFQHSFKNLTETRNVSQIPCLTRPHACCRCSRVRRASGRAAGAASMELAGQAAGAASVELAGQSAGSASLELAGQAADGTRRGSHSFAALIASIMPAISNMVRVGSQCVFRHRIAPSNLTVRSSKTWLSPSTNRKMSNAPNP